MKPCWVLLDVRLDRKEIRMNEGCDTLICVRLGFQPSTSPSSWSCAEIEQDRAAGLLRFLQRGIDIFAPLNSHGLIVFLRMHYRG